MRDIKFRDKDYSNKWRYGDLVQEKWGQGKAIMIKKDKTAWSVLEETIGQYTGLKDKNRKEIYEGDIVKVFINKEWRIGKIIYEHSGFTIDVTNNKELEYGRTSILENLTEVIGNIYDNPELLEEGE